MRTLTLLILLFPTLFFAQAQPDILVQYPKNQDKGNLDGRIILIFSTESSGEPRYQIADGPGTQQVFGMDVQQWIPGTTKKFDPSSFGYPIASLKEIRKGHYTIQAVFHQYETFRRADGHAVQLPMDRGEGQHWNTAPGNLLSKPRQVHFDPRSKDPIQIELNEVIPSITPPEDTRYIKHIRIQSQLLTAFWGRPMYLGAHVLLPEGWDTHPNVQYPLAIFHGHFPDDFGGFRTTPPDTTLKPDYIARFNITGYNRIIQQEAYDFYKLWTGPNFPRVLAVEIQHPTPYYDDSYAVNSANNGPYGDAIVKELIPAIEKQFRGIGKGWARFMYGGSTGGWEALAAQVFYPDQFNGCYAACPDPIDFRAFTTVNIYSDTNAYYNAGPFRQTLRPGLRNYLGHVAATVRDMNQKEVALGTNARSGDQWDAWESVFSPVDKNGYPKRIWDRMTGKIDTSVAAYWRENYDLSHIIRRDWPKIGNLLKDKIRIYCGDMDNFYLNNAVYLTEDMLSKLDSPKANSFVDYGDRAEHCWNGDHSQPNYISRLRYHSMFITKWAEEMKKNAPADANLRSWRY